MKKIFKKLLIAVCALVLCVVCFAGCSWLQVDRAKYYNQLVVSVGEKNFNMLDLTEAFSSYGYQYYQQGSSLEDSVKQTIENMIDRYLVLDMVKADARENGYDITDQEKLEIKKQAFDYMQDSIYTFETKIRKEWGSTVEVGEESAAEPLRPVETDYTATTTYDRVTGTVTRVPDNKEYVDTTTVVGVEYFGKAQQIITNQKVSDEAWARYVKSLQDQAKSEGRSTKESDVLAHEQDRLITLMTNNLYLDKYQKRYLETLPVDVTSVLDFYRQQYKAQKAEYTSDSSAYHTAMQSASSKYIYYHLNAGTDKGYVNVKHILINFTDAQKQRIKEIENDNVLYPTEADKQAEIKRVAAQTTTTFELDLDEDGVAEKNTRSAAWVYEYVQNHVVGTFAEKSAAFDDLVYVFNDDTGFNNSEFDYVVNLDTDVTDQMVKPFADGVRALDAYNGGEGPGAMDMIISEYGYHIIFHDGRVENLVEENNIDNISDAQLLALLCTTTTTPDSNKTIFDLLYDKLKLDDNKYNDMTQQKVKDARNTLKENGVTIVYYEDNYKSLWGK